ncbi:uncharacterized protein LOC124805308 isoform X2 [Schistocerca piceifrons]|uniref:uncharacterized protein LOC124805308 isoform X2 n=1 Tax=Schistocerca piceifrons TaxID=274613 RepID=UPI001F5F1356|nr:uncharacterized protein LOC124805308 isoform X2 [Schistocerca piceifrons]
MFARLIIVLDSWGQLPVPGFLEGNTALLGNFDECLNAGAKYCLATVHLPQASLRKLLDGNAPTDDLLAAQRQVLATTPGTLCAGRHACPRPVTQQTWWSCCRSGWPACCPVSRQTL